jgi:cell division protein FtsL
VLLGLTVFALGHVAVQARMVEVGLKLAQEQAAHEDLLAEQRHLQLDIGRLKEPRRLVQVAKTKLGMTPQPASIRTLAPAPRPATAAAGRSAPRLPAAASVRQAGQAAPEGVKP